MNRRNIVILFLLIAFSGNAFALFGSGKNKLTRAEKKYLKKNNITYQVTSLKLVSVREDQALKGGYMSQDEFNAYVEGKIAKFLKEKNASANVDKTVDIIINIEYWRTFGWRLSSLAGIRYQGLITLSEKGEKRGVYRVSGDVRDGSILGDFKTSFGVKNKKERVYIDILAESIVGSLPANRR